MLPDSTHKHGRGLCARPADTVLRRFVCEVCRLRAQLGTEITEEYAFLLEIERARLITTWNAQTDGTASELAGNRKKMAKLDATMPPGARILRPLHEPFWPAAAPEVSLAWHMLRDSLVGGKGKDGVKAVSSVGKLRSAFFSDFREWNMDNFSLLNFRGGNHAMLPGSATTESLAFEQFHHGLRVRMGETCIRAFPMPPAVARSLERLFTSWSSQAADQRKGRWPAFYAAAARLAHVLYYTLGLRGTELWGVEYGPFVKAIRLDEANPCPWCGRCHIGLPINVRTKKDPTNKMSGRGFDLVSAPVTDAGLQVGEAAMRYLELRASLNIKSRLLFAKEGDKPWNTQFFWRNYVLPGLRTLSATGDRSVRHLPWSEPRQWYIRVYRRGAHEFYVKSDANKDIKDMVFGWKPRSEPKPGHISQVYYDIHCEDMVKLTSKKPESTRFGFFAED